MTTAFIGSSSEAFCGVVMCEMQRLQASGDAAVDIERMSVDEGGRAAGEKHRGADQFVHVAPASLGSAFFKPCRKFRIVDQRLIERSPEVARRDRIDLQAML